jgi:hypothetical protein
LVAKADTPFPPWLYQLSGDISISDAGVVSVDSGTVTEADLAALSGSTDGLYVERIAFFTYDVAVDLGTVTTHGLGVTLPAKAVITQSWYKIITQFSDSGSGTVALSCEDANNILTAGDITGISANTITTGASTGSAATMVRGIGAACEITATVATAAQDAGKLIGWVRYVVEN